MNGRSFCLFGMVGMVVLGAAWAADAPGHAELIPRESQSWKSSEDLYFRIVFNHSTLALAEHRPALESLFEGVHASQTRRNINARLLITEERADDAKQQILLDRSRNLLAYDHAKTGFLARFYRGSTRKTRAEIAFNASVLGWRRLPLRLGQKVSLEVRLTALDETTWARLKQFEEEAERNILSDVRSVGNAALVGTVVDRVVSSAAYVFSGASDKDLSWVVDLDRDQLLETGYVGLFVDQDQVPEAHELLQLLRASGADDRHRKHGYLSFKIDLAQSMFGRLAERDGNADDDDFGSLASRFLSASYPALSSKIRVTSDDQDATSLARAEIAREIAKEVDAAGRLTVDDRNAVVVWVLKELKYDPWSSDHHLIFVTNDQIDDVIERHGVQREGWTQCVSERCRFLYGFLLAWKRHASLEDFVTDHFDWTAHAAVDEPRTRGDGVHALGSLFGIDHWMGWLGDRRLGALEGTYAWHGLASVVRDPKSDGECVFDAFLTFDMVRGDDDDLRLYRLHIEGAKFPEKAHEIALGKGKEEPRVPTESSNIPECVSGSG